MKKKKQIPLSDYSQILDDTLLNDKERIIVCCFVATKICAALCEGVDRMLESLEKE
jgi:hypothetical protein